MNSTGSGSITLSPSATTARDTCAVFFGDAVRLHHSFEDPAAILGSNEERVAVFRRVRDELRAYLADFAQRIA
jgi:arsenate reductase